MDDALSGLSIREQNLVLKSAILAGGPRFPDAAERSLILEQFRVMPQPPATDPVELLARKVEELTAKVVALEVAVLGLQSDVQNLTIFVDELKTRKADR